MVQVEKEEKKEAMDHFMIGNPRNVEISNLKIRLVKAEKERAESVTRAVKEQRMFQSKLNRASRVVDQARLLGEQRKVTSQSIW